LREIGLIVIGFINLEFCVRVHHRNGSKHFYASEEPRL